MLGGSGSRTRASRAAHGEHGGIGEACRGSSSKGVDRWVHVAWQGQSHEGQPRLPVSLLDWNIEVGFRQMYGT